MPGRSGNTTYTTTHGRIIDGTAAAVKQRGVRDVTVEDILRSSSLSRRTFYQHFGNKEDAFRALYERITVLMVRAIRERVEGYSDPSSRLFAGLDAYLDFQQEGGELVAQLQVEASNPDSPLSSVREQTLDALVKFIETEVTRELGLPLDPLLYRSLLIGLEGMVNHLRRAGPFDRSDRDRVASIARHQFGQLLALSGSLSD